MLQTIVYATMSEKKYHQYEEKNLSSENLFSHEKQIWNNGKEVLIIKLCSRRTEANKLP